MKNILFISYYFQPDNSVAAQRMSYWARNMKRYLPEVTIDVVTTSGESRTSEDSIDNIYTVPDSGRGVLNKLFKSDKGASWYSDLKTFFGKELKSYDVVIISGNPFLHFFIAPFLKNKVKCKVILDFRDPFARNERNVSKSNSLPLLIKRKFLVALEYLFSEYADHILVMNHYCSELLCSRRRDIVTIIDNGFDEVNLSRADSITAFLNSEKCTLIYLGSFARDRHITNLIEANESIDNKFNLLHVGRPEPKLLEDKRIKSVGLVPYVEAIGYAKGADIGLILASGKHFESTTKIFDYIGMNLPILIITNGVPKTGNLYEIVKDYPYTWWAKNDIESIVSVLSDISLSRSDNKTFNSHSYSRDAGLKKLIQVISPNL